MGAFHHARWMPKALYCLKIYLFKHQFLITIEEETRIRDTCLSRQCLYKTPDSSYNKSGISMARFRVFAKTLCVPQYR